MAAGADPVTRYSWHASVVMMKPGGTGKPRLVISARLAPLPPSRSLRSLLPSLKSYTNLVLTTILRQRMRSATDRLGEAWAIRECPPTVVGRVGTQCSREFMGA